MTTTTTTRGRTRPTFKIFTFEVHDVMRSRWLIAYGLFFLLLTEVLLRFGGGPTALLSLTNVVLLLIPLVSIVFGTMYLYQARDFVEMLLAQPVDRRQLFAGLYLGLALPLVVGFAVGTFVPFLLHPGLLAQNAATLGLLLGTGTMLTLVFVALAFWIAMRIEERVKGLAVALMVWLVGSMVYDGLMLLFIYAFAAYPLETPTLILTLLNPIDLSRVLLLLSFDIAALMGYTGAVFARFFGNALGFAVAFGALSLWVAGPLYAGLRAFLRKDF